MNESLLSVCNQFFDIKNLGSDSESTSDIEKYWEIIRDCVEEKNISNIGEIKTKIIQECPTFDVKNYGVKRFLVFLKKYYHDKIEFKGTERITTI